MSLLARILRPRGPAGTGAEATGLEAHDLAVHFEGVKAIDGVDLTSRPARSSG